MLRPLITLLALAAIFRADAIEITITDQNGEPIKDAEAAIILDSGAYQKGEIQGSSIFFEPFKGMVSLYIAAPGFKAESRRFKATDKASFSLRPARDRSSIIIYRSGELPGKGGSINPILDSLGRLYMYGTRIGFNGVSGPSNQPVTFGLRSPIRAEDSDGKRFLIYVIDISQSVSLVEYTH